MNSQEIIMEICNKFCELISHYNKLQIFRFQFIDQKWLLQFTKLIKQYILPEMSCAFQSRIAGTANLYPSISGPISINW
jgi:hypothetical protein